MGNNDNMKKEKYIKLSDDVVCDEAKIFKFYDKLRKKIGKGKSDLSKPNALNIRDFLFLLPDIFILLTRTLADKRIPKNQKIMISCIIGYIIMPIDLIPDFIPVFGFIDDFIIAIIGINYLLTEVDNKIILDNWPGRENLIDTVKLLIFKIENNIQKPLLNRIKKFFELFKV
jgi:uncharacterized membrane protein YkvA (DUF1232 family)